jgi:predicted nucleic acid-binding protein
MKTIDPTKKIILDADVIIHFCKGRKLDMLPQIYPNKLCIPDIVYHEALSRQFKTEIDNLIDSNHFEELKILTEAKVLIEYNRLQSIGLGRGESVCLSYCRYHDDVIGSSNLKDIRQYCESYNIVYLTTMDFLAEAYRTNKMDEAECDFFIYNVKLNRSRLPYDTIKEFLEKNI